ncbi:hypothetical protein C6988_00570 [Nitrosopumilus sp. b1]|uniref:HAMP domain-containing sensor histidine kinase n=1 Tax=Nitrosopumilus sp. b1 TaxID=2109907 RepID=UPI0015F5C50A|nr:HAMP domain-containing sensor histidine kinase [Nitrosopumilus sp. b1]KAF6243941.1 hypothetical protein C6988_00570 [Nitrosopumilus sp. b1]
MKFSTQLILLVMVPIAVIMIVYPIAFSYIVTDKLIESSKQDAVALADFASEDLANFVYFLDIDVIDEHLKKWKETYPVDNIYVMSADGKILSDGTSKNPNYGEILDDPFIQNAIVSNEIVILHTDTHIRVSSPIVITEKIGIIQLDYSLSKVQPIIESSFLTMSIVLVIVTSISLIVAFLMSLSIRKPIKKLQHVTHEIAEDKLSSNIDITEPEELRQLSQDLEIMVSKLKKSRDNIIKSERLSSIGELAGRISHDLRNPLSVINNAIFIIQKHENENSSPTLKKYLPMIKNATEEMNYIIKDVLDFVRTRPPQITSTDLLELLKKSQENLKIPENIKIILPTKTLTIFCDPTQMLVVFQNLFSNAIDAMDVTQGSIIIDASEDNDNIVLQISDTGPGIPSESIDSIFDPLFTTKSSGTGLGLVSCKTIVEQHGGTIKAENLSSKGAKFTIILPKKITN